MKPYYTVRTFGFMLLSSLLTLVSCTKFGKADLFITPSSPAVDLSTKISSTVNGFVTNESDQPVEGAWVKAGNAAVVTDQYGYFEIKNATVVQDAAVVTVIQPGYFNGIKTYFASSQQEAFLRIKLIPKSTAGSFNATGGGKISLPNGLTIQFPADAIVNEATGKTYTGTVFVAAFWINPTAGDLNRIMPGDLRGMNTSGEMKKLTSYGMAAVEMTSDKGEKLQIASGKKATMTMPVSADIISYGPATIPLWHFNEASGLWEEQGSAVKTGSTYVGEVSHFSFWNYDSQESFVEFNCTAHNAAGAPLQHVLIRISAVNNPAVNAAGYTNAQGYAAGLVPANTLLRMDIMGDEACNTPMYTQTFTTSVSNFSLGTIRIGANGGIATVTGTLTDCSNKPVTSGGVIMEKNGQYYRYASDQNGNYSFTTPLCNASATVNLTAFNAAGSQYGNEEAHNITTSTSNIINLKACGTSSSQYIVLIINGKHYNFTYPSSAFDPVIPGPNTSFIFGAKSEMDHQQIGFGFSGSGNGSLYKDLPLNFFNASLLPEPVASIAPVFVSLTEYGTVDGYFTGNFTGTFVGTGVDHQTYAINCSFRIRSSL